MQCIYKEKRHRDRRHLLRTMWCETINIFKDKDIMCPSGTFFNWDTLIFKSNDDKIILS